MHKRFGIVSMLLVASACGPSKATLGVDDSTVLRELSLTVSEVKEGATARREALPVAASAEESRQLLLESPELQQFLANEGRGWEIRFDRRSGTPMFLQGPGISWNAALKAVARDVSETKRDDLDAQQALRHALTRKSDALARDLLAAYPSLVPGMKPGDLVSDNQWSGALENDTNQTLLVTLRTRAGPHEHLQGRLTFVVKQGALIQIHAERATQPVSTAPPNLSEPEALALMKAKVQVKSDIELVSSNLKLIALSTTAEPPGVFTGELGKGYDTHLAYLFRFRLPGDYKTYEARIDAQNGELIDLFDANHYANVTGGVYTRSPVNNAMEVVVPFENVLVRNNGTPVTTDLGGNYNYAGGTALTRLAGSYIQLTDTCGNPNASAMTEPGNILLGTSSGSDCSLSALGQTTRAARNAFYHLNQVRQISQKWLGGLNSTATEWFGRNVLSNVNLEETCNAFWNGSSLNFFKSGPRGEFNCANTAEVADVAYHEYGHGLDANTKQGSMGDPAKNEAVADGLALLLTHDACTSPGFFTSGNHGETPECSTGVRDLRFRVTPQNIAEKCEKGACLGALGYQCHCESHVLTGALYDTAQALVQRYGEDEGWHQWERLYLIAFQNTVSYLPGTAGNAYANLLAADDDNGNIADGTPHADLIFQAFSTAGIAGNQVPRKAVACPTRPEAATLTAASNGGKISLSWTPVPQASSYVLLRRLSRGGPAGFLPLKSDITGTSYTDIEVDEQQEYQYVVYGRAGACTSPLSARATVKVTGPGGDDAIAPTVSVISPASGASISGVVPMTVSASDNVGVTQVEFYVDGWLVGVSASAPFTASWNTATTINGNHMLTARALDAAGNTGLSKSVAVTVANAAGNVLTNKVPVNNLTAPTGAQTRFTMQVPAGAKNLTFKTSGEIGDADLYVRFGDAPTLTVYDCVSNVSGNNETCSIPNPAAGTYYVLVYAFSAHSGLTLMGAYDSEGGSNASVLKNGVATAPAHGAKGSTKHYTFEVPSSATSLNFVMTGASGDADLYVKFGSPPSSSSYDCRPYESSANERCDLTTKAGTWYVMVQGYSAYTNMTLKATFSP